MFDVKPSLLGGTKFVLNINPITYTGPSTTDTPIKLSVPWQELQKNTDIFSLLQWRARITKHEGRNNELNELNEWVKSSSKISIKFITGEGGVGKTRLAAEFADSLQAQDWAAGIVDLRQQKSFTLNEEGSLLIIDYPEENKENVKELFNDLSKLSNPPKLRILFLTRQDVDEWQGLMRKCKVSGLLAEKREIRLDKLDSDSANSIYHSAQEQAEIYLEGIPDKAPLPVSVDDLEEWVKKESEHFRPLFLMAAGVYSALHPEVEIVKYTGREIIEGLLDRELTRLQRMAEADGFTDENVYARLLALAAIAGELHITQIKDLINLDVPLGILKDVDLESKLKHTGLLTNRSIKAPEPDIIAAAFTVKVFGEKPEIAPQLIRAIFETDLEKNLNTVARLSHDAEVVLQMHEHRLSEWLAEAVNGHVELCRLLDRFLWDPNLVPDAITNTAIAVYQTLSSKTKTIVEKVCYIGNLSNYLRYTDKEAVLEASKEGEKILREFAKADPELYQPYHAISLNNLSNRLGDLGRDKEANNAIKETVAIYRKLAKNNPERYQPDLACSLMNFSINLSKLGRDEEAQDTIEESVEIYRQFAKTNPTRFQYFLAKSLGVLGLTLKARKQKDQAVVVLKEGINIIRSFAEKNPESRSAVIQKYLERDLKNLEDEME